MCKGLFIEMQTIEFLVRIQSYCCNHVCANVLRVIFARAWQTQPQNATTSQPGNSKHAHVHAVEITPLPSFLIVPERGVTRRLWRFQHAAVLERRIEFSLSLSIYKKTAKMSPITLVNAWPF